MAHFQDLQECTYFHGDTTNLRAIGWLENGQPFKTGEHHAEFLSRLRELAKDPWDPKPFRGLHACDLCPAGQTVRGFWNLFVPTDRFVFVAPELITHYVHHHGYRAPDEFVEAVMRCPPMGSPEYLSALERLYGPRHSASSN